MQFYSKLDFNSKLKDFIPNLTFKYLRETWNNIGTVFGIFYFS